MRSACEQGQSNVLKMVEMIISVQKQEAGCLSINSVFYPKVKNVFNAPSSQEQWKKTELCIIKRNVLF